MYLYCHNLVIGVVDMKPGKKTWQVLQSRAEGKIPEETAEELGLSLAGVSYHVKRARDYFNAANGYQTIALAIFHGHIHLERQKELSDVD